MSDPNAMTLQEAVEIVVNEQDGLDDEGLKRWKRARAIVDAAVEFIDYCRDGADDVDDSMLCGQWRKLRALERGEVQP